MPIAKVLVIDDDPATRKLMKFNLAEQNFDVIMAETGEEGLKIVTEQSIDIILTDFNLPDLSGLDLVRKLKEQASETEIIVITGYGSVDKAVAAIKAGAYYFLEKPVDFDELFILVEKALERRQQNMELAQLRKRLQIEISYFGLIGRSRAMQFVYETIEGVAEADANIFIIGESGTGKELVANAVHLRSHRSKKPMMQVNCAALPKELIESELFGHTKGAFTGAHSDKMGLIGRAAGGSLFLDEIGEMPVELQPKLLRVLQERVYYRVGSEKPLDADFRLIAATNRNPFDAIRDGHLREDLYYRLNTIEIRVPPLRERLEDIQSLADFFRQKYAERYNRTITGISEQAYERMLSYHWPGNVRELQNAMERAVLMCRSDIIEASNLPFAYPSSFTPAAAIETAPVLPMSAPAPSFSPATLSIPEPTPAPVAETKPALPTDYTSEELCDLIISKIPDPKPGAPMNELFKQLEVYLAHAAVKRTRGNKQAAANLLGIYRPRLYSLLRRQDAPQDVMENEQENFAAAAPTTMS